MVRVSVHGRGLPVVRLGPGDVLVFGRAPQDDPVRPAEDSAGRRFELTLPECAPHVSRVLGELAVGEELARLRWHGELEVRLSSLLDAPGGARRVTLTSTMSAVLDEGENHVAVLRARVDEQGAYDDLHLVVEVAGEPPAQTARDRERITVAAPKLEPRGREWFVALALAEPWLVGDDDYPRPPSNREIYERVLDWHGYAWNLHRAQRVDDAIRAIARLAFGPRDDPFAGPGGRRQNARFAVAKRSAEVRLVTAQDLAGVQAEAARRKGRIRSS